MHILDLLLGRRLANRESEGRRIGVLDAVPAMGLDAIASSAYGPEAAFAALLPLGAAGIGWIGWIMAPIVALLGILFASYWQTIRAYPANGGGYIVARENLGTNSALLAAAALMIDYVLNAAVAISAGVGALVSALPSLHPHMLLLCLGLLAAITLVNLRGTHEAGRLFALPTYLFLACFAAIIALGFRAALAASGHPQPQVAPAPLPPATQAASAWLLLRAFASGCTAMTGIEAVGNGMGALREPVVRTGHRTLAAIVFALAVLLAGIAWLAHAYGIGAMDQTRAGYRSVLAQLAAAVVGEGPFYYVAIGALLCVLALSANTSFVAFPRLCRMLATDGFLPRPFANAGRRLVFSVGITYLAACAGVLLVVFGGITEHLIPLFAIGAFLTFTLSQAGMVVHWRRVLRGCPAGERRRHRVELAINAVGALASAAAALVMAVGKFREGAWITLLVIPCVIALLKTIRAYYDELDARMRKPGPLDLAAARPPLVLVVMEEWNRLADRAISLALSLSPDVIGVHLVRLEGPDSEERHRELRHTWHDDVELPARAAGFVPPSLRILEAQYRTLHEPLLKLAQALAAEHPDRRIAVLVPELVKQRWYQHVLHGRRARRLRAMLLRYGGSRLTVISAPWYLDRTEAPPDAERAN
jgi:amino acid transporter